MPINYIRIPLRLRGHDRIFVGSIDIPDHIDDKAWTHMLAVIDTFRPGFVRAMPSDYVKKQDTEKWAATYWKQ